MNRFLNSDQNTADFPSQTVVTTIVDTTATTDALALRATALEGRTGVLETDVDAIPRALEVRLNVMDSYVSNLLEQIRILQDTSYSIGFNAYTEAARRKIAADMPYPSYVQITTISDTQSASIQVLNATGALVSTAVNNDVWQIVPTGGNSVSITSSHGVSLSQKYGLQNLELLSTDGATFHIGTQPGPTMYSGSFIQPAASPGSVETV